MTGPILKIGDFILSFLTIEISPVKREHLVLMEHLAFEKNVTKHFDEILKLYLDESQ